MPFSGLRFAPRFLISTGIPLPTNSVPESKKGLTHLQRSGIAPLVSFKQQKKKQPTFLRTLSNALCNYSPCKEQQDPGKLRPFVHHAPLLGYRAKKVSQPTGGRCSVGHYESFAGRIDRLFFLRGEASGFDIYLLSFMSVAFEDGRPQPPPPAGGRWWSQGGARRYKCCFYVPFVARSAMISYCKALLLFSCISMAAVLSSAAAGSPGARLLRLSQHFLQIKPATTPAQQTQ